MVHTYTSDGSDSDANSHGSSPRVAPTPGYSLEHHDSRSNSPQNIRAPSPNHRSRSNSNGSHHSDGFRSRSQSKSLSHGRNSHSPNLQIDNGSNKSRSRSRSGSARSNSRSQSRSPSGSRKSASRSPSRKSDRSVSGSRKSVTPVGSRHSRSRSRSGSRKSGSRHSRSRSGSHKSGSKHSRSHSGTPVTSRKSISRSRSRSHSGSRSRTPSRSRSRSKSRSSGHASDAEKNADKRKRKVLSSESGVSDNEAKAPKAKKVSAIVDSDSEEEIKTSQEPTQANELFGDADDITDSDEDAEGKKGNDKHAGSDGEKNWPSDSGSDRRKGSDDERSPRYSVEREKTPEMEPIPETRIDVDIPRIATDLGKDMHFVKLPNFLSVETRPFDAETYEDEIDEEETLDEEGRQRLKLKVGNTIRWRNEIDETGNAVHESNARFVKWSDGSMSLHLGNEIFDVYKQPLQGDHNHLFIRQGTGLQGQAVFRTKLTFRPHSTESFTHKKMTMSLADRSQKTSGIKILTNVGHDPDADRYANLKKEEEKLRQAMRAKHQTKPKRSRDSGANHHNSSYRDHDEGSEDEGGISIAAIKNKFKKNAPGGAGASKQNASAIYSSDEEDGSDFETRRPKKIDRTKALKALKDSDDDDDDDSVASGEEDKSPGEANEDEDSD